MKLVKPNKNSKINLIQLKKEPKSDQRTYNNALINLKQALNNINTAVLRKIIKSENVTIKVNIVCYWHR